MDDETKVPPLEDKSSRKLSANLLARNRPQSHVYRKVNNSAEIGSEESDEDDQENDDDEDGTQSPSLEGVYNAADYEHLNVSPEIKELFQYITRYTPQTIELDHKLKPFIPDFIPAVGDIDAFIKVLRPDEKSENVGLTVIDEPCAKQSDPTVLGLQLRAISKETSTKQVAVKTIDDGEKSAKEIDSWVKSISDLHRSKPPPAVHYSRNMPSIDNLMQEWDSEFEELLKTVTLPSADLDCDLAHYASIVCSLLDIPVYKSKIQSLHVLFSLYLAFKKHQHFQSRRQDTSMTNKTFAGGIDQLIL